MGATSVRLVHYPHAPNEIETAARLGILVTQESGLTWIGFRHAPASTLQTGINILERVVQRDWNNPAFFAILLANESTRLSK
jgi:beta-galactosidase/beta-glucuronidase